MMVLKTLEDAVGCTRARRQDTGLTSTGWLVPTALFPVKARAVFSVRPWARMVGGDNAAARFDPNVAVCGERKQDQVAVGCFCPLEGFGVGWPDLSQRDLALASAAPPRKDIRVPIAARCGPARDPPL